MEWRCPKCHGTEIEDVHIGWRSLTLCAVCHEVLNSVLFYVFQGDIGLIQCSGCGKRFPATPRHKGHTTCGLCRGDPFRKVKGWASTSRMKQALEISEQIQKPPVVVKARLLAEFAPYNMELG